MKKIGASILVLLVVQAQLGNIGGSVSKVEITKEYDFSADLVWARW